MANDTWNELVDTFEKREQCENQTLIDKLNLVNQRLVKKDYDIRELTYERTLIVRDVVDILKSVKCSGLSLIGGMYDDAYWQAWKYSWLKKQKEKSEEDKKNLKEYKPTFNVIVNNLIFNRLLLKNEEFKLKEISMYNYGEQYWFQYTYKNKVVEIVLPCFSSTNEKNYLDMIDGYKFYECDEYIRRIVASNLDYRELAKSIEKWVKEQENKND